VKDGDYAVLAQSDDDIFDECVARLKIAQDADTENRREGELDRKFRYVEQWPDTIATARTLEERPSLTINLTDTVCRRVENGLRQQRPRIKAHPVDGGADVATAEVIEGLIRHVETISNASVAYDIAGTNAIDVGWGFIRVKADYLSPSSFDKQELKIASVRNPMSGYIDPLAVLPDGSDMRWFIFAEEMSREEYKRNYPRKDKPNDFTAFEDGDWDNKERIRLAEYFRIREKPEKLYLMSDGTTKFEGDLPSEESMAQAGYTIALDKNGEKMSRPSARPQVQWFRIEGHKVVDRRDLPGKYIPVVRVEGNAVDINGKVVRFGMVRNFRDPARMLNYWRTAQTERYALAPKAPWVAAEGQVEDHPEWNDANRRNYSVLTYKPVESPGGTPLPPPQRQAPVPVESGMAEAALSAERDFMAVAGMPQEGQDGSRVMSGNKYLARRQAERDLTHYQFYDNQAQAIAQVGRILLDLIPYYYDTPRMQRIIGEDGKPSVVKLNDKQPSPQDGAIMTVKNDLTTGQYDVVMDSGPGYQTKREEGAEQMLMLLESKVGEIIAKVAPGTVVRNMDFAGSQELADQLMGETPEGLKKAVEGLPDQAKSIITGLQAKLQQADDLIQKQHLEIKYRIQSDEIWAEFERWKTSKTEEGKRHDTLVKSDTALGVAEIQGATQLLNTNTEAGHDRRAAQEMIDRGQDAASRH
jgi:hypothetical protein